MYKCVPCCEGSMGLNVYMKLFSVWECMLKYYIYIHYCVRKYKFIQYMLQITIYSSFPFFMLWLYSLLLSAYQSKLIRRKSITVTTARKISTFLGKFSCSTCSNFHIKLWQSSSTIGFEYVSRYCLNGTKCT